MLIFLQDFLFTTEHTENTERNQTETQRKERELCSPASGGSFYQISMLKTCLKAELHAVNFIGSYFILVSFVFKSLFRVFRDLISLLSVPVYVADYIHRNTEQHKQADAAHQQCAVF